MSKSSSTLLAGIAASAVLSFSSAFGAGAVVPGFNSSFLGANDDGSTELLSIGFSANFFGNTYTNLYANNNGNLTFNAPLGTFTPFNLIGDSGNPIIAPFFADVDTRGAGSDLLRYGAGTFDGKDAFGVTWAAVGVGYFGAHVDKLNKFQTILVDRSDTGAGNFDIYFNYDQIQWETGDASGGVGGFGGSSARAGFSSGAAINSFEIPGSGVNGALLDNNLSSGLIHGGNTNVAGRYLFEVRNGSVTQPTNSVPDSGSTVMLLGVALAGLAAVRRRFY
jgi:hypothetical protein